MEEVVYVRRADNSIESLEAGDLGDTVAILVFAMSQSSPELIYRYTLKHFN